MVISWTSCLCSSSVSGLLVLLRLNCLSQHPLLVDRKLSVSLSVRDQVSHSLINSHDYISLYLNITKEKGEILDRIFADISTVWCVLISSHLPFDLLLSFPDVCTLPDFHIIFMLWFRTALFHRDVSLYFAVSVFTYGQNATVATSVVLFRRACGTGINDIYRKLNKTVDTKFRLEVCFIKFLVCSHVLRSSGDIPVSRGLPVATSLSNLWTARCRPFWPPTATVPLFRPTFQTARQLPSLSSCVKTVLVSESEFFKVKPSLPTALCTVL